MINTSINVSEEEISYNFIEIASEENKQKLDLYSKDIKSIVKKCLENGCDSFAVMKEIPEEIPICSISSELTMIYSNKVTDYYHSEIQKRLIDV